MKLLKTHVNGTFYQYVYVCLTGHSGQQLRTGVHRIVAFHFLPPAPKGTEINHKDMDKSNNHYSNLEWITHESNMQKARQQNPWRSGRDPGFTVSKETKRKMGLKKVKKVLLFNDSQNMIASSVYEACRVLNTNRRTFSRYSGSNKPLHGYKIKVLSV
jgi:hypothetical protein